MRWIHAAASLVNAGILSGHGRGMVRQLTSPADAEKRWAGPSPACRPSAWSILDKAYAQGLNTEVEAPPITGVRQISL